MRPFTPLIALSLALLVGCSGDVKRYIPSPTDERASLSSKNIRLFSGTRSEAFISTVYLNEVYPRYDGREAIFLVSFYTKERNSTLYFSQNGEAGADDYVMLLNGEGALFSQQLENDDLLLDLMPVKNSWYRYYYVRYRLPEETVILSLESDRTQRALITYQKEQ